MSAEMFPPVQRLRGAAIPWHRGFSFVELLIAIAGIAVLAALLLGVSVQLSERSKTAKCAHQLRQIWVALNLYANENQGRLPGPSYLGVTHSAPSVSIRLLPYTGNSDLLWDCPARPKLRELRGYTGYLQGNVYITGIGTLFPFGYPAGSSPEKKPMTMLQISQLPDPALCPLLIDMDAQNYNTPGLADHAPGPAHSRGRNVLYYDGRIVLQPAQL